MYASPERVYDMGMVAEEFAKLEKLVDDLAHAEPDDLADEERIVALYRLRDQVDAALTKATAAFETRGDWRDSGARNAAAWLAHFCHQSTNKTKATVRLGRDLRDMERVAEAWSAGEISREHVGALSRVRKGAEEPFARDEKALVDAAVELRYWGFKRQLDYWVQDNDPERSDRTYQEQEAGRKLHLSQILDDVWVGDFELDPIRGAIVKAELDRLEQKFFEEDWAEAKARLGAEPTIFDLARTMAQRRADALVEMAARSRSAPVGGRRPEPLFSILVGFETFAGRICELADGTVIPPSALVSWLEQAWIERVVFASPSRVIDVGETRRLFSGATRRAIEVRDRQCFHPTCDLPAEQCQIDHVIPYTEGGPTIQSNGRPACGFHNRDRNREPSPDDDVGEPPDDPDP